MRRSAQQSGFSLLELIVSVGLLTLVMAMAFQLMVRSQVSFDANQMLTEAHANADFAVNRVAAVVRGAGANPSSAPNINALAYLENPDARSVRIRSDYNGDEAVDDRLGDPSTAGGNYLVGSEDITLKWFETAQNYNGVDVPAYSLTLIDNTPDPPGAPVPLHNVPVVIASNIRGFSCTPAGTPVRYADVTITGGPSRPMPRSDPRYREFTRTIRIRLRSF